MTLKHDQVPRRAVEPCDQSGYVLATVLGLLVLSTLLIIAMLAVSQSTIHIEQTGRQRERQSRAAESAVQVAINQIRNSETVATANPLNRKQPSDPGYLTGQPSYKQPLAELGDAQYTLLGDPTINSAALGGVCIPPSQLIDVDGYQVRVFCYPQDLSQYDQNGNVVAGIPQDDGAPAVRLVGGQYQGDTSNPGLTDVAASWKTTFPFSSAMSGFNQTEVNNTKGQLLYTGPVPMKVVGGVQVRDQIAAVSSGAGPALDVQGAARQGGKGMFDAGSGALDCGIAKANDPNSSPKADVRIDSLFVPVSDGLQCNQSDMASMAQTGSTSPNGEWDNDRVQRSRYQNDWTGDGPGVNNANVPDDCADIVDSGTGNPQLVIGIAAGAYDSDATAKLNHLFECDNRTWIFERGNYWFDVNDTSKATTDPARNSLMFNNRTSNWVFGPPKSSPVLNSTGNWAPENFPEACNRGFASPADGYDGTSITLSSRTGLYHRAGRVAICGPISVKPVDWDLSYPQTYSQSTAIYQRPATSLGARLLPTGLTVGDFTSGTAPQTAATIQADDGAMLTAVQSMPPSWWDGAHTFTKSFSATGLGAGAPNVPYPGPGAVSSIWVDVTGTGDRVTGANAKTRLDVTLADGTSCWTEYGPGAGEARRLPGNNVVTSYNLLDPGGSGTCKTNLSNTMSREGFYKNAGGTIVGTDITATFTLNPPQMNNNRFSWWDWWPWWRDNVIIPGCNALNSAIDWLNYTFGDIINWYAQCDDRPPSVSYSVNSVALRLGWSPVLGNPENASDGPPANPGCPNCIPVTNFANAVRVNSNGSLNEEPTYPDATITTPAGFAPATSYSAVRYTLTDPTLLDGFLPLQDIQFGYKIKKVSGFQGMGGADNTDSNIVQFTLKENIDDGIWCRQTVRIDPMNGSPQSTPAFNANDTVVKMPGSDEVKTGCIRKLPGSSPGMLLDGTNGVAVNATEVEVADFVSHYTEQPGNSPQFVAHYLDVGVIMANRGTSKVLKIDFADVSATAGDKQGAQLNGYPKPLDPFTVTWSPLNANPGGDGAWGDASFNVWGSVSVPNNDVRVIWNRSQDASRNAGQLGFPIFNSGKQPYQRCNPQNESQCQPALVAAALGSWTTMTSTSGNVVSGTWPALAPAEVPDPLASTGNVRLPFRQARIEACVVDPNGSGNNGDLLPRVITDIKVGDRDGRAVVPGSTVTVKQWQSLRSPAFQPTANALTNDCATGS